MHCSQKSYVTQCALFMSTNYIAIVFSFVLMFIDMTLCIVSIYQLSHERNQSIDIDFANFT